MITEVAEIEVKPGMEAHFIAAVEKAKLFLARAEGCHYVELNRGIESPAKFILIVGWESVAHHTEKFMNSPDFQEWRKLVGDCFAGRPNVYHVEKVV